MDSLAEHIRNVLKINNTCTVYRPEVARVWPQVVEMTEQRNGAIQQFARERGWKATIVDLGLIVTFEKMDSP